MRFLNYLLSLAVVCITTEYVYAYKEITLEDIYLNRVFQPEIVSDIRSMNDGKYYLQLKNYSTIKKFDYKTGKEKAVIFSYLFNNFINPYHLF